MTELRREVCKTVDVSKARAKLTVMVGAEKQDVELKPAGDRLEAKGSFKVGANTKVLRVVSLAGTPSHSAFRAAITNQKICTKTASSGREI